MLRFLGGGGGGGGGGGHAFTNVFIEVPKYYYSPHPLLNQQLLLFFDKNPE